MAERRMFSNQIVESDAFYDMPTDSQALYTHLCMNADDDGFVNNPQKIRRTMGVGEDCLKLLVLKRFILRFESGVMVIKHWRMQNSLRKDRYKPSQYLEEKKLLYIKPNGAYTFDEKQGVPLLSVTAFQDQNSDENIPENGLATDWQPNGNQRLPQYSIDKNSIDGNMVGGGKLNNIINTTHTCAREGCEQLTVEKFGQLAGCEGWERYPNGEVYREVRNAVFKLIDDGEMTIKDISHELIKQILDSMYCGQERRQITDLPKYILAIVKRLRKAKAGE